MKQKIAVILLCLVFSSVFVGCKLDDISSNSEMLPDSLLKALRNLMMLIFLLTLHFTIPQSVIKISWFLIQPQKM